MPGKLFYLDDRRAHTVIDRRFTVFSVLETEPGPRLVVAKGTVEGVGIGLRLEVHGIVSGLIGFDETEFSNVGPGGVGANIERNSFMLVVAANMPFGGVGVPPGAPVPPPNRAAFLARRTGELLEHVTNLKIISLPVDEIAATVMT